MFFMLSSVNSFIVLLFAYLSYLWEIDEILVYIFGLQLIELYWLDV